ncbi:MAG: polysaccharide deacetylase family protein [Peptococcaceae bacterium]|nr:polysaccharide deacetylase family protein [Peptococcaceae bacterium]
MQFISTLTLIISLALGSSVCSEPVQNFWQDDTWLNQTVEHEIDGIIIPETLADLDNTPAGWGQGVHTDEQNRPLGAVNGQNKYGQYDAYFIAEPTSTIYLTLDEGYENGYTAAILDVLKEKQCPAVFFVTMDYVKKNPELIQRMIDEGHVIGNHSLTHPAAGLPTQSMEEQVEEIMAVHRYVEENFGYTMYLFRYPAGIHSEQSLALVQQLGYTSVFWSFAHRDWETNNQPDPAEALTKVVDCLHPGAIYLLHAVSATNTEIMGDFIDQARANGYTFGVLE